MRIAVDARTVFSPARRGTGKNLVDLYSTLARQQPSWDFVLFHQLPAGGQPFDGLTNARAVRIDIPGDRWNLWQDLRLPLAARWLRASVLHCPGNTAPLVALTPVVVTIHDLIPLETAPNAPRTQAWFRRVQASARLAARVVTPSEYSRHAIVHRTGVPDKKVVVNYWAPDRACLKDLPAELARRARESYGVPANCRYILTFGAADPRKNTSSVIEAWSRISPDSRRGALLLVVGIQDVARPQFEAEAAAKAPDGSCLIRGFAPQADLPALMSGASALCYPSKSEGFGLPILDAFACGTPVITSTTTSLPEVAGEAALLVDPEDTTAIAHAMETLLQSPGTAAKLREAGKKRLEEFSWERCASTLAKVFCDAAARRSSGEA